MLRGLLNGSQAALSTHETVSRQQPVTALPLLGLVQFSIVLCGFQRRGSGVDDLARNLERIHDAQLVGPTALAVHRTLHTHDNSISTEQPASLLFEMLVDRHPHAADALGLLPGHSGTPMHIRG